MAFFFLSFLINQSNKLTLGCRGDAKPSAAQGPPSRRDMGRTRDGEQEMLRIALNSLTTQINEHSIRITGEWRPF